MKQTIWAILRNYTYKPGCTFRVFERYEGVDIILDAVMPDVSDPLRPTTVTLYRVINRWLYDSFVDTDWLVEQTVRSMVRELELHEIDEWFRCEGKCVTNPHPELSK